ncbi:MAG: hypothetical protein LBP75_07400 [Planctomycetota bacterium]|jgi:hypothetical protein|nr:hypothetical protein [Planctomycetota bacterium]
MTMTDFIETPTAGAERPSRRYYRGGVPSLDLMTPDELDAEIMKGYEQYRRGETIPAAEVYADLYREFGVR